MLRKGADYLPAVDVFLPVCNEPIALLANAWDHILALAYPRLAIYVLDDGGDESVRELSMKYGFQCEHDPPYLKGSQD